MLLGEKLIGATFSKVAVVVVALITLSVLGFLDYVTGYEISFAVFYLVPVGIAAWYAGRNWGLVFALASSLAWYGAERAAGYPYNHPTIPIWNALVRLAFFVITALLLSALLKRFLAERELARADSLTGLLNSRAWLQQLEHDMAHTVRTGEAITVAYIDLDDFKRVNDEHGHIEGDRILSTVARKLLEVTRRSDAVGRLGGDEFALILPATELAGARSVVRKLRGTLDGLRVGSESVTCSIGAVVFGEPAPSVDEAVAAADRLMYEAKNRGKNTVVIGLYPVATTETDRDPGAANREAPERKRLH